MNALAQSESLKREREVRVDRTDYQVTTRPGQEEFTMYVSVEVWCMTDLSGRPVANGWWRHLFSETVDVEDRELELDAIRYCFKRQRSRMKDWINSWRFHREQAAEQSGGKRGHSTRLANDRLKTALEYAVKWKTAKAIWKELTKL